MILCSVWITESCDGLKSSLRILTNLGNTCFANATLQAILHIPLLQEYINIKNGVRIVIVNIIMI